MPTVYSRFGDVIYGFLSIFSLNVVVSEAVISKVYEHLR